MLLQTEEGNTYSIKTISNANIVTSAIALQIDTVVGINTDFSTNLGTIRLDTNGKKIIPLGYTFSAILGAAGQTVEADIQTPYYAALDATQSELIPKYRIPLAKTIPYVQRNYYTDNLNYGFITRYNQIIFSVNDFIETNSPFLLYFTSTAANALGASGLVTPILTLPAQRYIYCTTFLYAELD